MTTLTTLMKCQLKYMKIAMKRAIDHQGRTIPITISLPIMINAMAKAIPRKPTTNRRQ
jgi:hypothetical protein